MALDKKEEDKMEFIESPLARLALKPSEAAEMLGIKVTDINALTKQDLIPHIKLGGLVVYRTKALLDWIRRIEREQDQEMHRRRLVVDQEYRSRCEKNRELRRQDAETSRKARDDDD